MPKPVPFLWFDGQAEAAAELYTSVFPRSAITEISRTGPGEPAMTVSFTLDGEPFTALNGGPQFAFTEAISFQVPCADQEEVDRYWSLLSEGGEEGRCGWLKDRFGLSWQVVPTALPGLLGDPDPDRAQRAMTAMMGMAKLDIAAMRAAADAG
ncbi:VOC family protein [Rhodococcus antarcticus]|jgi:predicted 3-demethylubiquinone-9 3-methyltransferase (glyoxalase superfamily)|uniref:VOC family protein n=1 Tax=Rhodococcus antarcticus TaxID=2987751 RepID=A0ABY6NZT8_9NOCA|nr:VOC family protein [Rhodococcus antarcticus]UZJ24621.1 VOC family protein [Rhodococcus antarcticus]